MLSTFCLFQGEAYVTFCLREIKPLFERVLIGYPNSINEISMHGRTEILGALPEAGAQSGGESPTLTCKTCLLGYDFIVVFLVIYLFSIRPPKDCRLTFSEAAVVVAQTCFAQQSMSNGV